MSDYPPPPSYSRTIAEDNYGRDNKAVDYEPGQYVVTEEPRAPPRPLTEVEKLYRVIGKRVVYDFEKVTCFPGQPSGLEEGVGSQLPTELAEKGITATLWAQWVSEIQDVQKMAPSICGCMLMFCFPAGFVQSILCAMFCPISMDHPLKCLPCYYGDWYVGLQKWTNNVNKVLNTYEMHAKLLTYKPFNHAPKSKNYGSRIAGKDHNYEMSFLVIAMDRDESLKLQQESWDHGVNDKCCSGIGRIL